MPRELTEIDFEKNAIVRELFVDTADDNYIIARWCYFESLNVDFAWMAVHALEKYYKAALLLNGLSGHEFFDGTGKKRSFGHDVVTLHAKVLEFASDLLPLALIKPPGVGSEWRDEATDAYIRRLCRDGSADNRYQLFGFSHHPVQLHKLDILVFAIRRLCITLEGYYLNESIRSAASSHGGADPNFSNREFLVKNPNSGNDIGGKLMDAISGRRGDTLQQAALKQNFAFAPPESPPTSIEVRTSAHNPILWRHIILPLEQGDAETKRKTVELANWVTTNIKMPKDLVDEIRAAIGKS